MSKTMEEITADIACVNLNKPVNLVLEDLLKPELSLFIKRRKTNGSLSPELTTGNKISKHIPTLYYFIHILLDRHHSGIDDLKFIHDESFIQMFSRDIEPMKSKNDFPTIYSILVSLKVVEMKSNNEPNKHRNSAMAYYFRLADTYLNAEVVQHQIQVKSSISEKVESGLGKWSVKQQNELDSTSVKGSKQFVHQYQALKDIRLDVIQARIHVGTLMSQNLIEKERYNSCIVSINAIENQRIYITRSPKCNRYYTPVTCMPREVRPFIVDKDGNALNELDYSSFNAFAVYKIVNTWETEFQSNGERLFFEHELSLYRSLLSGGNFYTDFKHTFLSNEPLSRDDVKEVVLRRWFNGKLNSRNRYKKLLDLKLPNITKILNEIKVKDYKGFSHLTMKMESELVNDIVYKQFIDIHPDVIMYTIFDCILVEQKYSAELYSLMLEEGSKYFNLNCFVKAKAIV
jgi:hypothetical protein